MDAIFNTFMKGYSRNGLCALNLISIRTLNQVATVQT